VGPTPPPPPILCFGIQWDKSLGIRMFAVLAGAGGQDQEEVRFSEHNEAEAGTGILLATARKHVRSEHSHHGGRGRCVQQGLGYGGKGQHYPAPKSWLVRRCMQGELVVHTKSCVQCRHCRRLGMNNEATLISGVLGPPTSPAANVHCRSWCSRAGIDCSLNRFSVESQIPNV
jgi:hypothetical protein